jgi:hypothetical protein
MRETQLDKRPVVSDLIEYFNLRIASIDDVTTNAAYRARAVRGLLPSTSVHAHQARESKMSAFLFPD